MHSMYNLYYIHLSSQQLKERLALLKVAEQEEAEKRRSKIMVTKQVDNSQHLSHTVQSCRLGALRYHITMHKIFKRMFVAEQCTQNNVVVHDFPSQTLYY